MMDWDRLNDSLWLSMLPAAGACFALMFMPSKRPRGRWWRTICILLGSLFVIVGLAALTTTIVLLGPGKPLLDRIFEDVFTVVFLVLTFGCLLYILRLMDRFAYGLVEIGSALLIAGYTAWTPDGGPVARALALLAAIYIVVRGLDNLQVGWAADTKSARIYRALQAYRNARLHRNSPGGVRTDDEKAEANHAGGRD